MRLAYLLFDATDEASGAGSFDAMASVLPDRLPALMAEVDAVLGWARRSFGAPSAGDDGADWDYELRAVDDGGLPPSLADDPGRWRIAGPQPDGRVTLTLTLSGSAAFVAAFRDAFPEPD